MAIRSAWWMRDPTNDRVDGGNRYAGSTTHHLHPHQRWPNQGNNGLAFKELERFLRDHPGTYCSIYNLSYSYDAGQNRAKWGRNRKAKCSVELGKMLLEKVSYLYSILRWKKCGVLILSSGPRRHTVLCSACFSHCRKQNANFIDVIVCTVSYPASQQKLSRCLAFISISHLAFSTSPIQF